MACAYLSSIINNLQRTCFRDKKCATKFTFRQWSDNGQAHFKNFRQKAASHQKKPWDVTSIELFQIKLCPQKWTFWNKWSSTKSQMALSSLTNSMCLYSVYTYITVHVYMQVTVSHQTPTLYRVHLVSKSRATQGVPYCTRVLFMADKIMKHESWYGNKTLM